MKHLITLICIAMLSIAGTQNAQAQTKEETIDWLNTHANSLMLKEHRGVLGYTLIDNIDNKGNLTTVTYWSTGDKGTTKSNIGENYWLDNITYKRDDYEGRENWLVILHPKDNIISSQFGEGTFRSMFIFSNEESAKRVHKAFLHLAKLLGTKPKPNANTF